MKVVEGGQQEELAGGELAGHAQVGRIGGHRRGGGDAAGDVIQVGGRVGVGHGRGGAGGQAGLSVHRIERAVAVDVGEGLAGVADAVAVEVGEGIERAGPALAALGGEVGAGIADRGEHGLAADDPAVGVVADDVGGGRADILRAAVDVVHDIENLEGVGGEPGARARTGDASLGADVADAQAGVAKHGLHVAVAGLVGGRVLVAEQALVGGGGEAADVVAHAVGGIDARGVVEGVAGARTDVAGADDEVLARGSAAGGEEVLDLAHRDPLEAGAVVGHRSDGREEEGVVEDRVGVGGAGVVRIKDVAAVQARQQAGETAEAGRAEGTRARDDGIGAVAGLAGLAVPTRRAAGLAGGEVARDVERRDVDAHEPAAAGVGGGVEALIERVGGLGRTAGVALVVRTGGTGGVDEERAVEVGRRGVAGDARAVAEDARGVGVVARGARAGTEAGELDEAVDRTGGAILDGQALGHVRRTRRSELLDAAEQPARDAVAVQVDEVVGRGIRTNVVLEQRRAAHVDQPGLRRSDRDAPARTGDHRHHSDVPIPHDDLSLRRPLLSGSGPTSAPPTRPRVIRTRRDAPTAGHCRGSTALLPPVMLQNLSPHRCFSMVASMVDDSTWPSTKAKFALPPLELLAPG